jgi:hypothetical protein
MKIQFIPTNTADVSYNFVAGYICHDTDETTRSGLTSAIIVAHENSKILNMQRPWKYYRKLVRNIIPSAVGTSPAMTNNRGYVSTTTPAATQSFLMFCNFGTAVASKNIGFYLRTLYISAIGRQ